MYPGETLGQGVGVRADLLLAYESGETDIPVGILFKIAKRFRVELSPC